MKRAILTFAASAWVAVSLAACRTAPSHPPTFKDLHALLPVKGEQLQDFGPLEKFRELLLAMQFTPAELRKIRDSRDVRLMVGTGAVAPADADSLLAVDLLRLALANAPDDPAPLAALACRATRYQDQPEIAETEFIEVLKRWRRLEPENSVPYYLDAARLAKGEKFEEAARTLAEASRHPKFDSHCVALRLDIVAAADFVGYPKFTARYFALSFFGETPYPVVGLRCLRWEGANEQVARDCVVLGKHLEAERALFCEMGGLALQSAAAKKFPQTVSEAELKRIVQRQKRIKELGDRTYDLLAGISEKRYVAFLDEALAGSEAAAAEKLISEYGSSAK